MSIDSSFFLNLNTDDGLLLDEQLLLSSDEYFHSAKLEPSTKPIGVSEIAFKGSNDMLDFNFILSSDGSCNVDSLSMPEGNDYQISHLAQGNPEQSSRNNSFPDGSLNSMLLMSYSDSSLETPKNHLSLHSEDSQFPPFAFPNSNTITTSPLSTPTSYLITPIYEDPLVIDPTSICRPCDVLEYNDSFTKSLSPSAHSEKSEASMPTKRSNSEQTNEFSPGKKQKNDVKENERLISEFDVENPSMFEDLFRDIEAVEINCRQMSEIVDPSEITDMINEFLDTESSEGTPDKEDVDSDYTPLSSRRSSISSFGADDSHLIKDKTIRCSTEASKKSPRSSVRKNSRKKSISENVDIQELDETAAIYPCDFPSCGKAFTRLYNLKSHYRTHTDDRPFSCDKCDQTFSRNHDLKRHYKIHSGVKPFNCEHCGKKFSRMDALGRHRAKRPQCRE